MWQRISIGMAFALLVFSSEVSSAAEQRPFPTNYRDLVAAQVKQTFTDPYSLRDVMIASPRWDGPVPGYTDLHPAWMVCFSANARNQQGGYDGIRTHVYVIRDGQLIWYLQASYSIDEVSLSLGHGLLAEAEAWAAQGFTQQEIFDSISSMVVTTFVHAYCRDAQWQAWSEMEGR